MALVPDMLSFTVINFYLHATWQLCTMATLFHLPCLWMHQLTIRKWMNVLWGLWIDLHKATWSSVLYFEFYTPEPTIYPNPSHHLKVSLHGTDAQSTELMGKNRKWFGSLWCTWTEGTSKLHQAKRTVCSREWHYHILWAWLLSHLSKTFGN